MPIQAPQWTEYLSCPVCCNAFDKSQRKPYSISCGHTLCKICLSSLHRSECPFDQVVINVPIDLLPVNTALLKIIAPTSGSQEISTLADDSFAVSQIISTTNVALFKQCRSHLDELALHLRCTEASGAHCVLGSSLLSRPMQRKLVTLINCQLVEKEGRARIMKTARLLGERTVTELILQHQNPQQLSANLWAAVRARGCQFLGPAMQEEVLRLVLLALEDGSALSRKVLVMFVVQRLEPHFPQASKTSIGHVVQLLYRASCFKVNKRDGDSSLMQLKDEFRTYDTLRREHDAQIVQIATEAGLRIVPDQWSALLYGDSVHKSHMQSIIDKLQTPHSFSHAIQELLIALQRTGDPAKLSMLRSFFEQLAAIQISSEATASLKWKDCNDALEAVKRVVSGLVSFIHQHGNRRNNQDSVHLPHTKYKINMCRDLLLKGHCPRVNNCTFAHSNAELERHRLKCKSMDTQAKDSILSTHEKRNHLKQTVKETKNITNNEYASTYALLNGIHSNGITSTNQQKLKSARETVVPIESATNGLQIAQTNSICAPHKLLNASKIIDHERHFTANGGHTFQRKANSQVTINSQLYESTSAQVLLPATTPASHANHANDYMNYLHVRRQQIILQLEATQGHNNRRTTFERSDSILRSTNDDDCVSQEYDSTMVSRFGPICRMTPEHNSKNVEHFEQYYIKGLNDLIAKQKVKAHESKEVLLNEWERVKIQISELKKQLEEFKFSVGNDNLSGHHDNLKHELTFIEQSIFELQKETCLKNLVYLVGVESSHHHKPSGIERKQHKVDEAMYEEDIVNDIRQLELKWQEELRAEDESQWNHSN